jgi:hypothetical protein
MNGPPPPIAVCVIRIEMRTDQDFLLTITTSPEISDPRRSHRDVTTTATTALGIVAKFLGDAGIPLDVRT